ncbi:MAG: MHYT domain-containing protein [Methylococcales bacterium]
MIATNYNLTLVALSYAIAVFGSYTALNLAVHIPLAKGRMIFWWLAGAAIALGGGAIWSMHFIGMLAYNMPMNVNYDPILTFASLFMAIVLVGIGLFIVGRGGASIVKLILAGIIAGSGVVAMHYTGMAAMIMPADISYDMNIVGLSALIAVVASIAALWLAFNLRGKLQQFGSAFVMGIAVCGMHYTAMTAATITPNGAVVNVSRSFFSAESLGILLFGVAAILLSMLLFVTLVEANKELAEEDYLA